MTVAVFSREPGEVRPDLASTIEQFRRTHDLEELRVESAMSGIRDTSPGRAPTALDLQWVGVPPHIRKKRLAVLERLFELFEGHDVEPLLDEKKLEVITAYEVWDDAREKTRGS